MTDHWVTMGRIVGVYGIKGWLRVKPYTQQPDSLIGYQRWYVNNRGQWQAIHLETARLHGKGLIAKLQGIDQPEQASLLAGCDIAVQQAELPKLNADEFYWHELMGLTVVNTHGHQFGQIDRMLETGANDVMVIKRLSGADKVKELLIPYIWGKVVKQVDLPAQQVLVDWHKDWELL